VNHNACSKNTVDDLQIYFILNMKFQPKGIVNDKILDVPKMWQNERL
jgi:hypothetical protein